MRRPAPSRRALTLLAALLAGACGGGETATTAGKPVAEEPETRRLVVSYLPFIRFAPLVIAEQEGYYRAQGLEVELVPLRSPQALPGLIQGRVDVVGAFLTAGLFNIVARGAPVRIVAGRGSLLAGRAADDGVLLRPEVLATGSPLTRAAVASLRFSLREATAEAFLLDRALARHGLTLDDVRIVVVPPVSEAEALAAGVIDGVVASEPHFSRLERAGAAGLWFSAEELAPGLDVSWILYGPRLLHEDPEAGRRFMVAYLQGVRRFMEGPTPQNLQAVAELTGLEVEVLADLRWPAMRLDGRVDPAGIQEFQQWASQRGYLDRVVEPGEYWEPAFVEHASRVLDRRVASVDELP